MAIVVWIILGLATGFGAAKLFGAQGQHLIACLGLGALGALAGAVAFGAAPAAVAGPLQLHTANLAVIGACLVLALYLWAMGRRLQP